MAIQPVAVPTSFNKASAARTRGEAPISPAEAGLSQNEGPRGVVARCAKIPQLKALLLARQNRYHIQTVLGGNGA